jgi:hypothetical protein
VKSIPAFSKEIADFATVKNDEDGDRAGFTEHVHIHKIPEREARKGLADFSKGPDLAGNDSYPDFKKRSDDGLPDFPAPFSKKNISGGPKKPRTPA